MIQVWSYPPTSHSTSTTECMFTVVRQFGLHLLLSLAAEALSQFMPDRVIVVQ